MNNHDNGNHDTATNGENDRSLLPPGFYKARADKSSVRFGAAQSGNEQIAITFDLLDPKAEGYQARITWIGTLAAGALDITLDGVMAAGWDGVSLTALDGVGDVDCSLKVKHEDDQQGVPRARVAFVNRAAGAFKFKTELDANSVAGLEDKIAGAIMAARERAAAGGSRASNPTSGTRQGGAGGGYAGGGGRKAVVGEWDGTGPDPSGAGSDIPF